MSDTEAIKADLLKKREANAARQRAFHNKQKLINPNYKADKAAAEKVRRDAIKAKNKPVNDIINAVKEVNIVKETNDINDIKKQPLTTEGIIIKKGMIYIIEHNSNPTLRYVGKTTDGLNKRWNSHLSSFKQFNKMYYRLYFCVNYYGIENFSIREYKIYNNITTEYLDEEEKKYIFVPKY
jgi:hypothetical protein